MSQHSLSTFISKIQEQNNQLEELHHKINTSGSAITADIERLTNSVGNTINKCTAALQDTESLVSSMPRTLSSTQREMQVWQTEVVQTVQNNLKIIQHVTAQVQKLDEHLTSIKNNHLDIIESKEQIQAEMRQVTTETQAACKDLVNTMQLEMQQLKEEIQHSRQESLEMLKYYKEHRQNLFLPEFEDQKKHQLAIYTTIGLFVLAGFLVLLNLSLASTIRTNSDAITKQKQQLTYPSQY